MIKILADKIFNGTTSYKIENDGSVSYFGVLSSTSLYCKDIIKNIFSGKYLNYFKKFSAISIYDNCIISDILTNPITIDKMDYLFTYTKSLKGLKNNDINIKEISELEIAVNEDNQSDWVNIFKDSKIKTMVLKPHYSSGFNMKDIPPISGLVVDKIIISGEMVPGYNPGFLNKMDWEKIDEYMSFIKKNNKVKHIYVIDVTESTRTKFRDKFIKAKKIN